MSQVRFQLNFRYECFKSIKMSLLSKMYEVKKLSSKQNLKNTGGVKKCASPDGTEVVLM